MNNIPSVFWLVPAASITALAAAWIFFRNMMKEDEGTVRMREIAGHVRKGAMAYLKQQYKVVTIVFVILAAVFAFMAYVMKCRPLGAVRFPHRRILLRTFRLFGYENGDLRIGTYCQRCP